MSDSALFDIFNAIVVEIYKVENVHALQVADPNGPQAIVGQFQYIQSNWQIGGKAVKLAR